MKKLFREPASGFSHLFGALLSVLALAVLLYTAISNRDPWQIVSFSIYGGSMILLYGVSAGYHLYNGSQKVIDVLRKLDHSMIFVLIAGCYTPFCLTILKGALGYTILSIAWTVAIVGIVLKTIYINQIPRFIYTGIYLVMGWISVAAIVPLFNRTGWGLIIWLLAGGLFYTIGAVIYGFKKPNLIPNWLGFHEIFHIFTLLGSASHFWAILKYC